MDEFVSELVAFSLEQVDSLTEKAVLVLKTLREFVSWLLQVLTNDFEILIV